MQKIYAVHRQGTEEIDVKEFTKTLQKYFAKFYWDTEWDHFKDW